MKTLKLVVAFGFMAFSLTSFAQEKTKATSELRSKALDKKADRQEKLENRFAKLDKNKDGKLDASEFLVAKEERVSKRDLALTDKKKEKIYANFAKADANKDGFLDKEEYAIMLTKAAKMKKKVRAKRAAAKEIK